MAGNLLTNGDLEEGTGNSFTGWSLSDTGTSTITEETDDVFCGTRCIRMHVPDGEACNFSQSNLVELGQECTVSFWAKRTGPSTAVRLYVYRPNALSSFLLTEEWTKYSFTMIATTETRFLLNRSGTWGSVDVLVDKLRVEQTPVKYATIIHQLSGTLSGTVDFTETGFGTPKAALVFLTYTSGLSTSVAHSAMSIGFWDGTTQECTWSSVDDNLSSQSDANRGQVTGSIAKIQIDDTTTLARYTIANITDGVRITLAQDNTSGTRYATVILFSGADVESYIGTFTPGSTNGTYASEIGVGFRPDLIFSMSAGTDGNINTNNCIHSFGATTRRGSEAGSHPNRAIHWGAVDNQTTCVVGCYSSSVGIAGQYYNAAMAWQAKVTKITSNGFTSQTTGSTSGDELVFLALKLPEINIDLHALASPTSTGLDPTTGLGFKPGMIIVAGTIASGIDSNHTSMSASFGGATSTAQSCVAVSAEGGALSANCDSWSCAHNDAVLKIIYPSHATGISYVEADLDSFDDDGYTLNYSVVGASARNGWAIAFEDPDETKRLLTS